MFSLKFPWNVDKWKGLSCQESDGNQYQSPSQPSHLQKTLGIIYYGHGLRFLLRYGDTICNVAKALDRITNDRTLGFTGDMALGEIKRNTLQLTLTGQIIQHEGLSRFFAFSLWRNIHAWTKTVAQRAFYYKYQVKQHERISILSHTKRWLNLSRIEMILRAGLTVSILMHRVIIAPFSWNPDPLPEIELNSYKD